MPSNFKNLEYTEGMLCTEYKLSGILKSFCYNKKLLRKPIFPPPPLLPVIQSDETVIE